MMEHPEQAELQIPTKLKNRQIMDLAVVEPGACGQEATAAFLFSDNLLVIFDLASRTAVFKVKYNDATDNISKLFFVADRYLETPRPQTMQQPISSSSSSETTLMGFFLMVETKLV